METILMALSVLIDWFTIALQYAIFYICSIVRELTIVTLQAYIYLSLFISQHYLHYCYRMLQQIDFNRNAISVRACFTSFHNMQQQMI